jgi:hypothetical protein
LKGEKMIKYILHVKRIGQIYGKSYVSTGENMELETISTKTVNLLYQDLCRLYPAPEYLVYVEQLETIAIKKVLFCSIKGLEE